MAAIIFGWYTTKIKSYTPEELDLDNSHPEYQVRQRIFHIMYIPIIPIGKVYVFKQDKKFYKAPELVKQRLKERKKHRTPWYALIVPALVLLGALFAVSVYFYTEWKGEKDAETRFQQHIVVMKEELNHLSKTHYFELENRGKRNGYEPRSCFLKVVNVTGNQVEFLKSENMYESSPAKLIVYFREKADSLERVYISIDKLKKMIPKERVKYDRTLGEPVPDLSAGEIVFDNGTRYVIAGINNLDSPYLTVSGTYPSPENIITLEIKNIGEPARFVGMTVTEGNIQPETKQLQDIISVDNSLKISVKRLGDERDYTIKLTFLHTNGTKLSYRVYQSGNAVHIIDDNEDVIIQLI